MKEHILAKIVRYLIYAAAFVPLIIFADYISPFHFGKVVVFRSLIYILLVFYVLLIMKDRTYLPKMTKVSWAFFFFACAFSIATIFSVIPYMSMWGSLERMGGLFTFWHYFIYFLIIISIFRTEKDWLNLFKLVIGVGVLSAFYGFGQRTNIQFFIGSGGRERIFGTIGNPALFAGYQILCAFLSLTLFFHKDNSKNLKVFYGVSAFILTLAAMMTAVRGSVIGIAVGLLAFALLYSSAYRSKYAKKILLGLIALMMIFVVFALLFRTSSFVQNSSYLRRVTDFSSQSFTVQTRFWAWEAGLKGWKENPKTIFLGWGPENFDVPFSKYFNPKFFQGPGSETLFDRAHNMFVEVLVTMGLAGLLTYLWIFGSSLKVLWGKIHSKDTAIYGIGLIPMLIAYAIHNSFIFDTSANFLAFFTILGFISFLDLPKTQEANNDSKKKEVRSRPKGVNQGVLSVTAVVLFIAASVGIYRFSVLPSEANYATTRAIVLGWNKDFPGAVAKFKESIAYNVPGKYEYRNRFAQFVIETTSSHKLNPEEVQAIKDAIEEEKKNVDENKVDYLPYLYEARLYVTLGKGDPKSEYNDQALELALKTIEISPTFVRSYYEIGQAYLNKEDLANASKYFQKAAELNPDVGLSSWYWGVVEIERGNVDGGLAVIEKVIKNATYLPTVEDLGKLNNIYVKRNDIKSVVWVYEMLINLDPKNPQYRASLAVAYAQVGRLDDAVNQAKEAAKIDSKFEPEARAFIQSIGRAW